VIGRPAEADQAAGAVRGAVGLVADPLSRPPSCRSRLDPRTAICCSTVVALVAGTVPAMAWHRQAAVHHRVLVTLPGRSAAAYIAPTADMSIMPEVRGTDADRGRMQQSVPDRQHPCITRSSTHRAMITVCVIAPPSCNRSTRHSRVTLPICKAASPRAMTRSPGS